MIKRIVQMEFVPEKLEIFLALFDTVKKDIRNFPGCSHLELWAHELHPHVLFTFSIWESSAHLNTYRDSELFAKTWAQTKILFQAKPKAWSVRVLITHNP